MDHIQHMLDVCLEEVTGDAVFFIASLNDYYVKKGRLTPRQEDALREFYMRCDNHEELYDE